MHFFCIRILTSLHTNLAGFALAGAATAEDSSRMRWISSSSATSRTGSAEEDDESGIDQTINYQNMKTIVFIFALAQKRLEAMVKSSMT